MIADGPNGWNMALNDLAQDRGGARAIGQRARRDLERHWSAQMAPHVIDPALVDWVTA